ncbi:MAG: hypothetical protein QNJ47_04095 [Nostocaceae cyanobacterium]|nr:hypothetical protein [Nostocaceae cyanobacterium]
MEKTLNNLICKEATHKIDKAKHSFELKVKHLEKVEKSTNSTAKKYGKLQIDILRNTIHDFVDICEHYNQKNHENKQLRILEGLDIQLNQIEKYKSLVVHANELIVREKDLEKVFIALTYTGMNSMIIQSVIPTICLSSLSLSLVGGTLAGLVFGSAVGIGTGLGIGVIASTVLTSISVPLVGTIVAIGTIGFQIQKYREKALKEAELYEIKIKGLKSEIDKCITHILGVESMINTAYELVIKLNNIAINAIQNVKSKMFSLDDLELSKQLKTLSVIVAQLVDIMSEPVINSNGEINGKLVHIVEQYNSITI